MRRSTRESIIELINRGATEGERAAARGALRRYDASHTHTQERAQQERAQQERAQQERAQQERAQQERAQQERAQQERAQQERAQQAKQDYYQAKSDISDAGYYVDSHMISKLQRAAEILGWITTV